MRLKEGWRRIRIGMWALTAVAALSFLEGKPYVVVISFDGFRWDYPLQVPTPHLDALAARGVRAEALIPVFPSKTFPNHYSIATGLHTDGHGIVSNRFWDPAFGESFSMGREDASDGRWFLGEPIWVAAERQGIRTATLFWVGSEAEIAGRRPSYFRPYDESLPFSARVGQVIEWLSFPDSLRPRLVMMYYHEPDATGHRFGPDAPETGRMVAAVDSLLGTLVAALDTLAIADSLTLMVCSDHGMTTVSSENAIYLEDYLDLAGIQVEESGPFSLLWLPKTGLQKRLPFLLRPALRRIERELSSAHPRLKVYRRSRIPERWRYRKNRRIPDLLVVADEGWSIFLSEASSKRAALVRSGNHGYDNALDSMHAIFVASGPLLADGKTVARFSNVHIYPLIAHLLGIAPAVGIDGTLDAVKEVLK